MDFELITTQEELALLIEQISDASWLALDTEFMRESTYYPKLCLIQLATESVCACIDVLALEHIDGLLEIIDDQNRIKIFHSARQDLEVIYTNYKIIPKPLFDTQIAASALTANEQISYAELTEQTLGIKLAKTESRTNWSKRPLTSAQISYALDDVRYLGPVYLQLNEKLSKKQRRNWLQEECETLTNLSYYEVNP